MLATILYAGCAFAPVLGGGGKYAKHKQSATRLIKADCALQQQKKTAKKIEFQCQRVFYYTHVVLCHTICMRTGFACVDPGLESNSGPFPWSAIRWSIVKTGYITKTRICPCASILQSLTTDSKFVDILQTLMINSQIVYLLLTLMINS